MNLDHYQSLYQKHRLPPVQLWVGHMTLSDVEQYTRILLPPVPYSKNNLSLHPNYFNLSPLVDKKDITVEAVSPLAAFLKTTPTLLGARVILIHEAARLNTHATNALLKVLEDVPPHTFFILTTATPRKLLPTLRSRCTVFTQPSTTSQDNDSPPHQHMGKLLLTLLGRGAPVFNTLIEEISDDDVSPLLNHVLIFLKTIIDYGQKTGQERSPGMEKLYTLYPRSHWVNGYLSIEDYLYHGVKSHLPPRDLLRGSFFLMQSPQLFSAFD